MELVAISSLLALAVAIPLGIWISRPSQHRFTQPILQLLNIGQAVPKLALLALAMSVVGLGAPSALFGLWVATVRTRVVSGKGVSVRVALGGRSVIRQTTETN